MRYFLYTLKFADKISTAIQVNSYDYESFSLKEAFTFYKVNNREAVLIYFQELSEDIAIDLIEERFEEQAYLKNQPAKLFDKNTTEGSIILCDLHTEAYNYDFGGVKKNEM